MPTADTTHMHALFHAMNVCSYFVSSIPSFHDSDWLPLHFGRLLPHTIRLSSRRCLFPPRSLHTKICFQPSNTNHWLTAFQAETQPVYNPVVRLCWLRRSGMVLVFHKVCFERDQLEAFSDCGLKRKDVYFTAWFVYLECVAFKLITFCLFCFHFIVVNYFRLLCIFCVS